MNPWLAKVPPFRLSTLGSVFLPPIIQALFTAVVGGIAQRTPFEAAGAALIWSAVLVISLFGYWLLARTWTTTGRVIGGVLYLPLMALLLVYVHLTVYFRLFDGDSF